MLKRYRWAALSAAMLAGFSHAPLAFGAQAPTPPASEAPASTPSAVDVATQRFLAGQTLYEQAKYALAIKEFQASYDAVKSPNSKLYIARCIRKLGRKKDAYSEYLLVVAEAEKRAAEDAKYAGTLSAAKDELAELKSEVAVLRLLIPADVKEATIRIDNETIDASRFLQGGVAVELGPVLVSAEAKGRKPFSKTLEFKAGDDRKVAVELPLDDSANSKPASSLRTYAYVSGGVGVAGLALWGIFGVMAKSRYDDLKAQCQGRCDASFQDQVDAGRTETTVSNIGLAFGIAGIAAGAGLFAWDWTSSKKARDNSSTVLPSLHNASVDLGPRSGMVKLGGVF